MPRSKRRSPDECCKSGWRKGITGNGSVLISGNVADPRVRCEANTNSLHCNTLGTANVDLARGLERPVHGRKHTLLPNGRTIAGMTDCSGRTWFDTRHPLHDVPIRCVRP